MENDDPSYHTLFDDYFPDLDMETIPSNSRYIGQSWSLGGIASVGLLGDDLDKDLETLLKDDLLTNLNSSPNNSYQDKVMNYSDAEVNNNDPCIKTEVEDTFEDMINDTYESMMKSQIDSVDKPIKLGFDSHASSQGPVARSSPRVVKLRKIQPKSKISPAIHPEQSAVKYAKISPKPFDHHYHIMNIPFSAPSRGQPIVAGIFPQPIQTNTSTKQEYPTGPRPSPQPQVITPVSYTWKGFQGGLQMNTEADQKSLLSTQTSLLKQNHPAIELLPKPTPQNSQFISSIDATKSSNFVSLLKPILKSSTITTMAPAEYWPKKISLDPFPNKSKKVPKHNILKQYILKPEKIPFISPSGWVTKEDPMKEKRNQLERERRLKLAIYREKLRKMLPRTKEMEKVPTISVLGAAKEYCKTVQMELNKLELTKLVEERKKETLTWRLARLKFQLKTNQPEHTCEI